MVKQTKDKCKFMVIMTVRCSIPAILAFPVSINSSTLTCSCPIDPIVTGISTVIESANRTAKMMNLPNVEWGVKDTPPLTLTHCTHSRCTAATATSLELHTHSHSVPQWAKFGIFNFKAEEVRQDKENQAEVGHIQGFP